MTHARQNPGVAVSYGIEHEHVRWQLSLHNLKHILEAAEQNSGTQSREKEHRCPPP